MLSNDAFKLLKWLEKNDKWMTKEEIAKEYKPFGDRSFKTIAKDGYVETRLTVDEDSWVEYRISEPGKAYLKGANQSTERNTRDWLLFCMSVASLIISIIALLK